MNDERISAWCDDYENLCRKHKMYLVANDIWIQEAGEELDIEEACDVMRDDLRWIQP